MNITVMCIFDLFYENVILPKTANINNIHVYPDTHELHMGIGFIVRFTVVIKTALIEAK